MKLTGIGDEAGDALETQINAARESGWNTLELRYLEVPEYDRAHVHDLVSPALDLVRRRLEQAGLGVCCLSSNVLKSGGFMDPWQPRVDQLNRALNVCNLLQVPLIRIMSFEPGSEEYRIPAEVFRRVREVVDRCVDAGVQPVHENCRNYGGMSPHHALELLDKCPGLKWVFDTGNPIANLDRSSSKPWPRQDPWQFWVMVRDQVAHIHLKDNRWNAEQKVAEALWPGDGESGVVEVMRDAVARGYTGWLSIEPAMERIPSTKPVEPKVLEELIVRKRGRFMDYAKAIRGILEDLTKAR
jgi:sugar phosphate isomerase/epimerase